MRVGYRVCRKARENLAVLEEKTENKEHNQLAKLYRIKG